MDLEPEELQFLSISRIFKESIFIAKQSLTTFIQLTLTLIFPLSFAILAHTLFTHPLLSNLLSPYGSNSSQFTKLLVFQFFYLIFLFAFSLVSTAAVVFTVASLYTCKPFSFGSVILAVPSVLKRLFVTYIWVIVVMVCYYFVFIVSFLVLLVFAFDSKENGGFVLGMIVVVLMFVVVHVYVTALWHLGSVVSVLEPVYGFAAMRKSYRLLKGKTWMAVVMVSGYLIVCAAINGVFGGLVVYGESLGVFGKVIVGGVLVGVLVIVNLIALLVQSVFYYVCKSYHREGIDKSALYDHLGGYLGEYVPLKSSIQMENLDF